VVGKLVGLAVGIVEGSELGDGLGIKDGLSLGTSVGASDSGHSTQVSVKSTSTAVEAIDSLTPHVLVLKGGVNTHSSVFSW